MKIGYHASHEQFAPSRLLRLVEKAEQAGFQAILSSDHFHPWSDLQGESGFAWSWLGAAMKDSDLEFGVVNAPGQRYHPTIIAQAAATLDEMFPGRFWLCSGSGQALNEHITGEKWPRKEIRNQRLEECVQVMRDLWTKDYVSFDGTVHVDTAKLFTKPVDPIPIFGAAITNKTARWLSSWADGLITISKPLKELQKTVDAFREGDGVDKPIVLKVQVSYASSREEAVTGAWEQWKNNIFPSAITSELITAKEFDAIGEKVRKEDLEKYIVIGDEPSVFIEKIKAYADMGFEKIIIHNVNEDQENFIDFFGKEVLPQFKT